jgi:phosphatidate cytidylyltransferase
MMLRRLAASLDQTLRERILTGAVLGPVVIGIVLLDGLTPLLGLPLMALAFAVASCGAEEFAKMLRFKRAAALAAAVSNGGRARRSREPQEGSARLWQQPRYMGAFLGGLPPLFLYFVGRNYDNWVLLVVTLLIVFNILMAALGLIADVTKRTWRALVDFAIVAVASAYIGGCMAAVLFLRQMGSAARQPWACWPVLLLFAISWAVDTSAYFGGRAFGSRKLWPRVSPGKTLEGAVIGLAASLGVMVIAFAIGLNRQATPTAAMLTGLVVGLSAQTGDLLESASKRLLGAKDSGVLLPGHGGVLDRFDSVMLAAPVLWLCLLFVL